MHLWMDSWVKSIHVLDNMYQWVLNCFLIPQKTWVIANFKETQMKNMRIGQKLLLRSMRWAIKNSQVM